LRRLLRWQNLGLLLRRRLRGPSLRFLLCGLLRGRLRRPSLGLLRRLLRGLLRRPSLRLLRSGVRGLRLLRRHKRLLRKLEGHRLVLATPMRHVELASPISHRARHECVDEHGAHVGRIQKNRHDKEEPAA